MAVRVQFQCSESVTVRLRFQGMMLLQTLRWRCVDCVIHHERDVREE